MERLNVLRAIRFRDANGQVVNYDPISAAQPAWIDATAPEMTSFPWNPSRELAKIGGQFIPRSLPPLILHLTDGARFPEELQELLRELMPTDVGLSEPLLANCVIPRQKAISTLMLPTLEVPPFDDLTLLTMWQESSTLPKPIAKLLQGEEEVPQRFRCFCIAASRDAASQFLCHIFRILPQPGTRQVGRHPDLEDIRRTQRDSEYERLGEIRARSQEVRARRAYVTALVSLAISLLALFFTILKFVVAGK